MKKTKQNKHSDVQTYNHVPLLSWHDTIINCYKNNYIFTGKVGDSDSKRQRTCCSRMQKSFIRSNDQKQPHSDGKSIVFFTECGSVDAILNLTLSWCEFYPQCLWSFVVFLFATLMVSSAVNYDSVWTKRKKLCFFFSLFLHKIQVGDSNQERKGHLRTPKTRS